MDNFLLEINEKYSPKEIELESKLKILNQKANHLEQDQQRQDTQEENAKRKSSEASSLCSNLEAAKKRNHDLLKSLEVAKARLRSRATYNPTESVLEKAIRNYQNETALVPCTKKIYGPTYV